MARIDDRSGASLRDRHQSSASGAISYLQWNDLASSELSRTGTEGSTARTIERSEPNIWYHRDKAKRYFGKYVAFTGSEISYHGDVTCTLTANEGRHSETQDDGSRAGGVTLP